MDVLLIEDDEAFVFSLAKYHWLTMFDKKNMVVFGLFFGKKLKRPIVEDIAVLINLNKCSAFVFCRSLDDILQVLRIAI